GLFPNTYRPSWVSEGLATYYESRFTAGGRADGGFHRQLLTASVNNWPHPQDATLSSPKWPAGLLPYGWGSRFFESQATHYGDSLIPRFVEQSSGRLWPFEISHPLQKAGGESLSAGWDLLHRESRPTRESRSTLTVLSRGLRGQPMPRLSHDGRWLAYLQADG